MVRITPIEDKVLRTYRTPWRIDELPDGRAAIIADSGEEIFTGYTPDMRSLCDYANKLAEDMNRLVRSACG